MPTRRRGLYSALLGCSCLLLAVALVLGIGYRDAEPVYGPARVLLVPSGLLMALLAGLSLAGAFSRPGERARGVLPWLGLLGGIAAAGIGMAIALDAPVWRLISIPGMVFAGVLCLVEAIRGKHGLLYPRVQDDLPPAPHRRSWPMVRFGLVLGGLSWPLGVAWALGADL